MGAVEQLEKIFASRFGFADCVATGFGRSALRLALETLGVRGGEVAIPEFICAQVVEAVRLAGALPVFFRVEKDLNVLPKEFRKALCSNTRAAVLAHYFGMPLPAMADCQALCANCGIPLIEDCALALGVSEVGHQGDAAIFSFTKADWSYGGGLAAFGSEELARGARAFRDANFAGDPILAFQYGLLSRADFDANRPAFADARAKEGEALQKQFRLNAENFYDAGRFDMRMTPLCARRVLRLLEELESDTRKRRAIAEKLCAAFKGHSLRLLHGAEKQSSSAFLPFFCPPNCADNWIHGAAKDGITLRRTWPAFQEILPGARSNALEFLADQLLILEIHPDLSEWEVNRLAERLSQLLYSQAGDSANR